MKKADIDEMCDSKSSKDCLKCSEYDTCDNCGRRVCKYISVIVEDDYLNRNDGELWCRICCKEHGYSKQEIETGRVIYE